MEQVHLSFSWADELHCELLCLHRPSCLHFHKLVQTNKQPVHLVQIIIGRSAAEVNCSAFGRCWPSFGS